MPRKTSHWMTIGFLSLALFSGETSATAPCKGLALCPQKSFLPPGLYLGVFGGGGSSTNTHVSQRGTAFFPEAGVGPLAVDADAHVNSQSTWIGGAQLGYAWLNPAWCVTPALEFEGYYLHTSLNGTLDSPHTALPEHAFNDSLPITGSVYLINSVFTLNTSNFFQLHPYIGGGIGGAVLSVSGANSLQVLPPEPGVNHFSSETSASDGAFAGQAKAGLSYSLTRNCSIFAEYRFLYVAPTHFTFGSTVFPGHVPTSPWSVNADGMYYNLGALGIRFTA